ncbi:hypothetical protein [Methanoculleus sp. 7T]|uniref:hypothetical protein n=1 Tax=Methanoculleus sp. 7T TaxID=2937282 RepID=UPI0020C0FB89|nr:hypothetical protein [Methanoculleus sp. 7T]MCK8518042.1 hypothetical protein [Methanoculleus sp. 7T]
MRLVCEMLPAFADVAAEAAGVGVDETSGSTTSTLSLAVMAGAGVDTVLPGCKGSSLIKSVSTTIHR